MSRLPIRGSARSGDYFDSTDWHPRPHPQHGTSSQATSGTWYLPPVTCITLASGRSVHLVQLDQDLTYEGLLEGCPTKEMNARIIAGLMKSTRAGSGLPPYLVEPVERPIDDRPDYPFGTPAELPQVTCVGRFRSIQPARERSRDYYSSLRIVWFQAEFAMPIDPEVLRHIVAVPWDERAHDLMI